MRQQEFTEEHPIPKRLLTEAECARYIGMSRQFLRKARMNGVLPRHTAAPPFIRTTARAIRYDIHDVDRWILAHRVDPRGAER